MLRGLTKLHKLNPFHGTTLKNKNSLADNYCELLILINLNIFKI